MGNSINNSYSNNISSNNKTKLLKRSRSLLIAMPSSSSNEDNLKKTRLKSYNYSNTYDLKFITVS